MKLNYLFFAFLGLTAISCGNKDKDAKTATEELPQVKVVTVKSQDVAQSETYTATVQSDAKNNISPNAPMRIRRILVEVGDRVAKGQTIAILDATSETQVGMQIQSQVAGIRGQEATLKAQEASVKSYEAQVQQAQIEANRMDALYKAGGISKSENEAVQLQLHTMQRALEAQRQQLNALKASIAAQNAQLKGLQTQSAQLAENNRLVSPVSGYVTARNYDAGDMTGGLPVVTIEQTNPVKMLVNVSENNYKHVTKGMPVEVRLDAYDGELFSGKVTIVYPAIDNATHTFPVEVTIDNNEQRVRPGMFARATLDFDVQNNVVVPDEALVKQMGAGDRYVYVYDPKTQTVRYQKVVLGKHLDDKYEIKSGVAVNEKVVIAGQSRLADGRKVEVVK